MIDGLIWIFTARCDLDCKHCYVKPRLSRVKELPLEEKLKLIEEAGELGVEYMGFTGGEPFIHPDFIELLRAASEYEMYTHTVTNALTVRDEIVEALLDTETFVYASLDGPKEAHEALRGPGTWEKTVEGIKTLINSGIAVATVMAVSKVNYEYAADYVELSASLGADHAAIIPVMPVGRALKEELYVDSKEYMRAVVDAVDKAGELGLTLGLWCTPFLPRELHKSYVYTSFCRLADVMDVDPGGRVLLCDVLDIVVTDVSKGLKRAAEAYEEHPLIKVVTTPPSLPEPCSKCSARDLCRGGCYARSLLLKGSLNAGDPLCPRVSGGLFP